MESLEKKLSKYMIDIINNYSDDSFETIIKMYDQSQNVVYELKPNITIKEIIILCIQDGSIGFYLHSDVYKNLINKIKIMIKNENLENIITSSTFNGNHNFYISETLISKRNEKYQPDSTIPLSRINCWNRKTSKFY